MRANQENNNLISLGEISLQRIDSYTYLGSNLDNNGGTDTDSKIKIQKARGI